MGGPELNLRKKARGAPCLVRIPGVCTHDRETVVLAHIRRGGVAGAGQKPPDTCAVLACAACHDKIDGRTAAPVADLDTYILEGLCRTLKWWDEEGLRLKK